MAALVSFSVAGKSCLTSSCMMVYGIAMVDNELKPAYATVVNKCLNMVLEQIFTDYGLEMSTD